MEKGCVQRAVTLQICTKMAKEGTYVIPGASSARHAHLCRKDVETLFGAGYQLTEFKALTQPGQFAANEKITLKGPRGELSGVRILGPERKASQIEISITDSFKLGIKPALRMSGHPEGSPGGTIIGPKGSVELNEGFIISARHVHMSDEEAAVYGLKNGDVISLKKGGERETVFGNVVVRCGDGHSLELHIDTDEANAAMLRNGDLLEVIR